VPRSLRRAAAACALALVVLQPTWLSARVGGLTEMEAQARSAGSRRQTAVAIGRALFVTMWPAQITKVRVDGIGGHEVAGIILSGVKFHRALAVAAFEDEVLGIAARAFRASRVEEVDIWATVPLAVAKGIPVSGDFAQPTARTVFGVSLQRSERGAAERVHRGNDVFWDPAFKARLEGGR
jgi:hypothetical protein